MKKLQIDTVQSEKPVLFTDKQNCCGCSACYAVCPVKAIEMIEDDEGFLYPQIDRDMCIKCFRCLKVCAFKSDQEKKGYYLPESDLSAQDISVI